MTGRPLPTAGGLGRTDRLRGWVALTHPGPSAACTALTVLSALTAARLGGRPPGAVRGRVALAGLAMALAQVSTGCLNDVVDASADAVAQPYKPIPRGRVGRGPAAGAALLTGVGALVVAARLGRPALGWAALGLAGGWAHDLGVRSTPLSPLPWACGLATVPLLGFRAVGPVPPGLRPAAPLAAALAVSLHLANAAADVGGDVGTDRAGLAARLGARRAWALARALLVGTAAAVAATAPAPTRRAAVAAAGGAVLLVAADARRGPVERRPGTHPFLGHTVAAALLASGWLLARGPAVPGRGQRAAALGAAGGRGGAGAAARSRLARRRRW
ncbi:MAG TPA: UbiA family prenyltransferase [Candidatus Dormibacteraeota bacterium]|nr:UbiA family prenyltransferase [Candidatus Dormibacteraeota bacterium]